LTGATTITGNNNGLSLTVINNTATTIGAGDNTTGLIDFDSTSISTGTVLNLNSTGLTTGKLINAFSSSIALTTGSLGVYNWEPSSPATASGDLFRINIGAHGDTTGNLFNITDSGTSLFSVSTTGITSALPHSFTAAGDVSVAYDLQFTNQTASYIKSNAPLYIESGESFENNSLSFKTYGTGRVLADVTTLGGVTVSSNVSGTTPEGLLQVSGASTGKALVILNEAGDQNILVASASGVNIFRLSSTGVTYLNTGRPTKKISLSPEYPGAVLTASGSANIVGTMVSDASPSASAWRNYYEWNSSQTSLQDYTVAVRVTLPQDFDGWATSNAIQISYNTELTTANTNALDVKIYNDTDTPGQIVSNVVDNVSATQKTWTTVTIDDSTIDDGSAPDWDAAGETAVIFLKMYSKDNNYVQVGDIILSYLSKF
jgi:hypothetical protein